MFEIAGVISLELVIGPQTFKVCSRVPEERFLSTLRQLDGPFKTTRQRGAGQVGAADIGCAETRSASEQPCFGMQSRTPTIK